VRRGDFPPLRDTAAWEEAQEARRATATGEEIEQLPAAMLDTGAQR